MFLSHLDLVSILALRINCTDIIFASLWEADPNFFVAALSSDQLEAGLFFLKKMVAIIPVQANMNWPSMNAVSLINYSSHIALGMPATFDVLRRHEGMGS